MTNEELVQLAHEAWQEEMKRHNYSVMLADPVRAIVAALEKSQRMPQPQVVEKCHCCGKTPVVTQLPIVGQIYYSLCDDCKGGHVGACSSRDGSTGYYFVCPKHGGGR